MKNNSKHKKAKSKKFNDSLAFTVCKLTGNVKNLDNQLNKESDVAFAKALSECNVTDPVYWCRIKNPVQIEDLMVKIADSAENGRYDKHNAYVIVPSLNYSKAKFNQELNMSTIEKFEIYDKVFYVFAKHL